jgi:hypothetical protein
MKKLLYASVVALALAACSDDGNEVTPTPGEVSVVFDARYGTSDFQLNTPLNYTLQNANGTFELRYEFSKFRYWVSNVTLVKANGDEYLIPDSYFLIEETNTIDVQDGSFGKTYPATKREEIKLNDIPAGEYTAIKFSLGVDSEYNDNLTMRAGELNPLSGMATEDWMWFTSYIFTSTAGKITWVKETPETKDFSWETGSNEVFAEKEITFSQPLTIDGEGNSKIELEVDVKKFINLELPWANNFIGASQTALMQQLTNNFVNDAVSLKAVSSN